MLHTVMDTFGRNLPFTVACKFCTPLANCVEGAFVSVASCLCPALMCCLHACEPKASEMSRHSLLLTSVISVLGTHI